MPDTLYFAAGCLQLWRNMTTNMGLPMGGETSGSIGCLLVYRTREEAEANSNGGPVMGIRERERDEDEQEGRGGR